MDEVEEWDKVDFEGMIVTEPNIVIFFRFQLVLNKIKKFECLLQFFHGFMSYCSYNKQQQPNPKATQSNLVVGLT